MTDDDLVEILEEDEEDSELSESDAEEEEEEEEAEGGSRRDGHGTALQRPLPPKARGHQHRQLDL